MFSPYVVQPGEPCSDSARASSGLCVNDRYRAMWHDHRWATSAVPATSVTRRKPRDARALLMSRTSCRSKPDIRGAEVTASATGAGIGATVATNGAPAAAERRSARRSEGRPKQDILHFLLLGKDKTFGADAIQRPALRVKGEITLARGPTGPISARNRRRPEQC